ncbi:reprolysin-like metallopeptidase [Chryseobacterium fistulae]|uniref:Fibronectin type-III domain-containing protein n=1 Tax=Chryseobacterium fistulae TaxID=2675058 RepID=A0A6N4XRW7_9FLAO|nr:zinc-dependent metalloprotease family protein [Chryseobacterium fistulae]CAA7387510.1 hypothetical protein CHRY9393_01694 [Chryseobacterium fistulae]
MKKIIITLICTLLVNTVFGQWTSVQVTQKRRSKDLFDVKGFYQLDINGMREKLLRAPEVGTDAKPIEISLPTLDNKIEKFAVYSFPVVAKELAEQYQLGSYVGIGIDDPSKYLRFSTSPNDFQSMIIKEGIYQFIDSQNTEKTIYRLHSKSGKSKNVFSCSTDESLLAKKQLKELLENGTSFTNQVTDFSKSSDRKFRTFRLALSTTGEYTAFHGGTLAGALSGINATMTRVNGIFEKDLAMHLIVQNFPHIIYTDAATDPYSISSIGANLNNVGNVNGWSVQLQRTLSVNVGNENYDIGHLFGASGRAGSAGCIGCICVDPAGSPATSLSLEKGAGFTSPANGIPEGDSFDIDFVAHEMGHQLGANHTFSHEIEGRGVSVEPGSGSTIMGYAGTTKPHTDVQNHSDAYFHTVSINQIQSNLSNKACGIETSIINNPPVIESLRPYHIPKGTAFVLTAAVTDAESDSLTYTWEEVDNASSIIDKNNLGKTKTGATFRSLPPTTSSTRYFPQLSSVLEGVLDNSNLSWESVSMVPRTTKFALTVRDNNPDPTQQQTQSMEQTINVEDDGPFKIISQYASSKGTSRIDWSVVNTNFAPYDVSNVRIDYTTDNGETWAVLSASTPNDGNENFTFPSALDGQTIKVRISAIGNVFYAIKPVLVTVFAPCDGTAPNHIAITGLSATSSEITWKPIADVLSYKIRYKKTSESVWQEIDSDTNYVVLRNLIPEVEYEAQVAAVCSGGNGAFSDSVKFTTSTVTQTDLNDPVKDITLYPNPVSDVLNIMNISDKTNYSIYNAVGQLISSGKIQNNQINVSQLIHGVYLIVIKDNEKSFTSKFIKK